MEFHLDLQIIYSFDVCLEIYEYLLINTLKLTTIFCKLKYLPLVNKVIPILRKNQLSGNGWIPQTFIFSSFSIY